MARGPRASSGEPTQGVTLAQRWREQGALRGAGDRPVGAERTELGRLRAELARVKMERDIRKSATAHFAKESL